MLYFVATDQGGDVYLYASSPVRRESKFEFPGGYWFSESNRYIRLDANTDFPLPTWEEDPVPVRLTLHRIANDKAHTEGEQ